MKTKKKFFIYLFALLFSISACNKGGESPNGEFSRGVIIINEGNYTDADGSIGFFNPLTKSNIQDIYKKTNNETVSGVFQSIYFYQDKAYILDQSGHKIIIVEATTFTHIATISEGIHTPRYMTIANGKGYVSNWGAYDENFKTPNSYIAIIDLVNFNVSSTIEIGNGLEGMITIDEKIYVAASELNTVYVIDSKNDKIVDEYTIANGPRHLLQDADEKLWVLCNDYISSTLVKIDIETKEVLSKFEVANGAKSIGKNNSGNKIYYLTAPYGGINELYVVDNTAIFAPLKPLITGSSFYGLGIDPTDETIYLGLNSNPMANGTIVRYKSDGTEIDHYPSGRFPTGFVFRK